MTTLTSGSDAQEQTEVDISSLVDAWLLLRDIESGGERNRGLYILKARGVAQSNQIREFLLTDRGVELREVYLGEAGMLTGSARVDYRKRKMHPGCCWRGRTSKESNYCFSASERRWTLRSPPSSWTWRLRCRSRSSSFAQEKLKLTKWESDRGEMAKSRFVKGPRESNGGGANAAGGRK